MILLLSDTTCKLYNAAVSSNYMGDSDRLGAGLTSYSCFSSWARRNDYTQNVLFTSKYVYPDHDFDLINDGFYCTGKSKPFLTSMVNHAWLQIDLQSPQMISCVRFQVGVVGFMTGFRKMHVRLGNVSGSGSFVRNKKIEFFDKITVPTEIVEFCLKQPMLGQYVSLQTDAYDFIGIGEGQVLVV